MFLIQNYDLKKLFVIMRSQISYDTHLEEVIIRAKFGASTLSSFGGVKKSRLTERIVLYIQLIDYKKGE